MPVWLYHLMILCFFLCYVYYLSLFSFYHFMHIIKIFDLIWFDWYFQLFWGTLMRFLFLLFTYSIKVYFSLLLGMSVMLLFDWHERHPNCNKSCSSNSQKFLRLFKRKWNRVCAYGGGVGGSNSGNSITKTMCYYVVKMWLHV